MLQLNPPLPLITPKGEGYAHFVTDYGPEYDLHWTVLITSSGEIWTFSNREVRATKNITLGRTHIATGPSPMRRGLAVAASDIRVNGHARDDSPAHA